MGHDFRHIGREEHDLTRLRDRIGFDAGSRRLEDALAWAGAHSFHHVDFNADLAANHVVTGQGTIDFGTLFRRLEGAGYRQHYMMAFGTDADKLAARDFFVSLT